MSRTHKWQNKEQKYFTHNGNFNEDRNKVKKNGAGRRNWGQDGDELNDLLDSGEIPPMLNKNRRKSNSFNSGERLQTLDNKAGLLDEDVIKD